MQIIMIFLLSLLACPRNLRQMLRCNISWCWSWTSLPQNSTPQQATVFLLTFRHFLNNLRNIGIFIFCFQYSELFCLLLNEGVRNELLISPIGKTTLFSVPWLLYCKFRRTTKQSQSASIKALFLWTLL